MTGSLAGMMRARFEPQEWALTFEVEVNGGERGVRRVDAMALNLWHSRGHALHGFEFKTDRGDWRRELKQPSKADAAFRYCDRWWLVSTAGVAKLEEIPEQWGWLEAHEGKLRQRKDAPRNDQVLGWPRWLVAAMQRRTSKADDAEVRALAQAMLEPERKRLEQDRKEGREADARSRRDIEMRLAEIEKLTGIKLLGWQPAREISEAIRIVMSGEFHGRFGRFGNLVGSLRDLADKIEDANSAMKADAKRAA